MAAEIAQYDKDMYASLEADDEAPLSATMKASANRFISLCENDFPLAGPISAFNTQKSATGSDTRYGSQSTAPHVQEYGTKFINDDSDNTTLSNSQSSEDMDKELHQQQAVIQTGIGQGNVIAAPYYAYICH